METFSNRLKALRLEKNLSQEQLSKELGGKISTSAIGFWELGKRVPNLSSVILLASYFNVSVDYLAGFGD